MSPKFKTGFVALFAKSRDSKLLTFRGTLLLLLVIYERRVADGECKFIFRCNDILKIKRASVCCCRLIKSTNLGLASIIVLQFSIAFSSMSVPTETQ
jgi:hypothetical protein